MERRRSQDGFTLVELMVVVLIIGILVAIALPTFLGARERAQDRKAQAEIRNAFAAMKVHYIDTQSFTEDPADLEAIEPSLDYATGDTPVLHDLIYLHHHSGGGFSGEVYISTQSGSGRCFYLEEFPIDQTSYATSLGCGVADTQTYFSNWTAALAAE